MADLAFVLLEMGLKDEAAEELEQSRKKDHYEEPPVYMSGPRAGASSTFISGTKRKTGVV
jgi:hypothetical protein